MDENCAECPYFFSCPNVQDEKTDFTFPESLMTLAWRRGDHFPVPILANLLIGEDGMEIEEEEME